MPSRVAQLMSSCAVLRRVGFLREFFLFLLLDLRPAALLCTGTGTGVGLPAAGAFKAPAARAALSLPRRAAGGGM